MELYETIEKRRTIRKFNAPAAGEQLKKIILAGTEAPSGRNTQPWEFIHVEDPSLVEQIAQIKYDMSISKAGDNPNAEKIAAAQKNSFDHASVLAICHQPGGEAATWLAVENICLAAVAEGLGAGIAFYAGESRAMVEEILGLPADHGLTCILKVGVPGEAGYDRNDSPYGARRPEFSWLHRNRYGTPE